MRKMSQINWYPGHMAKSFREIEKQLRFIDLVIVLLDVRIPRSSLNPEVLKRIKNKPILILFNKADLADRKVLTQWEKYYIDKGYYALSIDATNRQSLKKIYPLVKNPPTWSWRPSRDA